MAGGYKNESKMKSDDLSSDFDRISLTPVSGNHQVLAGDRHSLFLGTHHLIFF